MVKVKDGRMLSIFLSDEQFATLVEVATRNKQGTTQFLKESLLKILAPYLAGTSEPENKEWRLYTLTSQSE